MKTLSRKRDERWSTAGELADALAEFSTRRKIKPSPAMLGTMMASVFSDEVAAWQDARRAGSTLGDHLVSERLREEREAEHAHRERFGPPPSPPSPPARGSAPAHEAAPSEISDVVTNGISIANPSLTASRDPLLNNTRTVMSCSSGTTFPTAELQVGMLCYRSDLTKLYELKSTGPRYSVCS